MHNLPTPDLVVEINQSVLKVDVGEATRARQVLAEVGLRTSEKPFGWSETRTRQYEVLWGNQTPEERRVDLAGARAALVAAGYEIGR